MKLELTKSNQFVEIRMQRVSLSLSINDNNLRAATKEI